MTTARKKVRIVVISPSLAEQICQQAIPLQFQTSAHRLARRYLIKSTVRPLVGQSIPEAELPELVKRIHIRYLKALIEPGAAVGAFAAATLSQDIAQRGFNTFHLAGSNKTVGGLVDEYDKLLGASKTINPTKTTIFFKNPLVDRLDIVLANRKYGQLYFKNIIVDGSVHRISELDDAQKYWYYLFWYIHSNKDWEGVHTLLQGGATGPLRDQIFLRLRINTSILYFNRLTLRDLVNVIFNEPTKLSSKSKQVKVETIRVIWSPDTFGEIHIYIRNESDIPDIKFQDPDDVIMKISMFLNMVRTDINPLLIKGIAGIKFLYPQSQHVWMAVSSVDKMEAPNYYRLTMDRFAMIRYNISLGRMIDFCRYIGMTPRGVIVADNAIVVESSSGKEPDKIVEEWDKRETKAGEAYNMRIAKGEIPLGIQPSSEYARLANRYFAIAEGGNIKQLLRDPDIDHNSLISNSVSEMYKHWGILLTQNYITFYLRILGLDSGSSSDPRHDLLFANNMCNLGIPLSYGYTGGRASERSTLVRATFERSVEELSQGGSLGSVDDTREPVTAVVIGSEPRIGTGSESFAVVSTTETSYTTEPIGIRTKSSISQIRKFLSQKRQNGEKLSAARIEEEINRYNRIAPKTVTREDKPKLRQLALEKASQEVAKVRIGTSALTAGTEEVVVEALPATEPVVVKIVGPLAVTGLDIPIDLVMPVALMTKVSAITTAVVERAPLTRRIRLPSGAETEVPVIVFTPSRTTPFTSLEPVPLALPTITTATRTTPSITSILP